MNRPGRLAVVALALLAAWSVWWLRHLQSAPPTGQRAAAHRIDYTMDKFEVTAMNAMGRPQYRLHADSMLHYADDDSSEFLQPRVESVDKPDSPLRLRGERGWMASGGDEIRLLGAVRIEGVAKQPFTVLTRDVSYKPDDGLAETQAAAELTSTGLQIRSVGMRVYIEQKRVQFLSKVHGRYEASLD